MVEFNEMCYLPLGREYVRPCYSQRPLPITRCNTKRCWPILCLCALESGAEENERVCTACHRKIIISDEKVTPTVTDWTWSHQRLTIVNDSLLSPSQTRLYTVVYYESLSSFRTDLLIARKWQLQTNDASNYFYQCCIENVLLEREEIQYDETSCDVHAFTNSFLQCVGYNSLQPSPTHSNAPPRLLRRGLVRYRLR
jgi:hypothetical protein